ncbi:MAG: S1C family serine protease [Streptosporangiaceae bacterium]
MRLSGRAGKAAAAVGMAVVIGSTGVAVGAATAESGAGAAPAAVAVAPERSAGSGYADVVRRVLPSVVLIRSDAGLGSGVVLDDAGNIVTNAHVTGDATRFQVQLAGDPKPREARLVGSYPSGDLAVIRVEDRSGLTPAVFGDSGRARAGEVVLAVGNPLGLTGSVTEGLISATGRVVSEPATANSPGTTLPDVIQTSAPINPGNSGGTLVTTSGQVIGIPTLAATSPQSGAQAQGIGFAIPSNLARDIAGRLIKSGEVSHTGRAAIGAQVVTGTGDDGNPAGTVIAAVTRGGPADRAGLRAGDVTSSVAGAPTPDTAALAEVLMAREPGQTITIQAARGSQDLTVRVILGELPGG